MKILFENIEEFRACTLVVCHGQIRFVHVGYRTGNGGFDRGVGRENL